MTREFEQILYEGMLVAFGKVLARYDAFAQASGLRDVGRERIDYLGTHGYPFKEEGGQEDLSRMIDLFVSNGFAERLEVHHPVVPMSGSCWDCFTDCRGRWGSASAVSASARNLLSPGSGQSVTIRLTANFLVRASKPTMHAC